MTRVVKRASVHEDTVQRADTLARNARSRRPRKAPEQTPALRVTKAHPLVVARAQEVKRPGQRVRVLSPTEVLIENVRSEVE